MLCFFDQLPSEIIVHSHDAHDPALLVEQRDRVLLQRVSGFREFHGDFTGHPFFFSR